MEHHLIGALTGDEIQNIGERVAAATDQFISRSKPILSAALPTGERIQIVLPPAAPEGGSISIRKQVVNNFTLEEYRDNGSLDKVSVAVGEPETPMTEEAEQETAEEGASFRLPNYQITFRDFADQETADRIAGVVNGIVQGMAEHLPLERLDGFTFANDYSAALAELDRSFGATNGLNATAEDFGVGVAMSPTVMRDGVIKTRVVMGAWFAYALIGDDDEDRSFAIHTIAHELSHVGCHLIMEEALPGVMLQPINDGFASILYRHSNACWDEYFASRWSAPLGPTLTDGYRSSVISALRQADQRIDAAKSQFWGDRNLEVVVDALFTAIGSVMKFAGYLFGHADGVSANLYDDEGHLAEALDDLGLRNWFDTLHQRVRDLFERTGRWDDFNEFFVLNDSVVEAAGVYGVLCRRSVETPMWVEIFG